MADMENQEDQKISECLQEAFGYSDEQLLKQLDHVNENFKDVSFAGAEERLMKRFMERKAEMERKAAEAAPETMKPDAQAGAIPEITAEAEDCAPGEESKPEPLEPEKKQGEKQNKKKIVRFGKKKILATAALVAVIAGMLGGTAIGKKNYFFRKLDNSTPAVQLDNDKNKKQDSELQNAYKIIEQQLDMPVLKMGYCPTKLIFENVDIYYDEAQLKFRYEENMVNFFQIKKEKSASVHYESDRAGNNKIYNEWLRKEVAYSWNSLNENGTEYEAVITQGDSCYYISGIMPETEFKKILEFLNFY